VRANAVRRTQREAVTAAQAKLTAKLRTARIEPHTLTLGQFLERWLTHLRSQGRGGKSLARSEGIVRAVPLALSLCRLSDLAPLALQAWLDEATVAPATVLKRYNTLHSALTAAVAWRLLADNPMDAVRPPHVPRAEMHALSEAETDALLARLEGTRYYAPALVAVTTGLRRGELLALRWGDVADGTLTVARAFDEVPKVPLAVKTPKGGKPRTVSLLRRTTDELEVHRLAQELAQHGDAKWRDCGLVFPTAHGVPWRPSSFSVGWGRLQSGVRFHDLRHTHATQLLRAGVDVATVSKRLGHANPAITLRVYSHVLEGSDEAAAQRLEQALGWAPATDRGTESDTSPGEP
jgi:integrase